MKHKKNKNRINPQIVEEFIDEEGAIFDVSGLAFYVRYIGSSDYVRYEILEEVTSWDEIRDFVIDYGHHNCHLWRKGKWKPGISENYRNKSSEDGPDFGSHDKRDSYDLVDDYELGGSEFAASGGGNYSWLYHNDSKKHLEKNVLIKQVNEDIFSDVPSVKIQKYKNNLNINFIKGTKIDGYLGSIHERLFIADNYIKTEYSCNAHRGFVDCAMDFTGKCIATLTSSEVIPDMRRYFCNIVYVLSNSNNEAFHVSKDLDDLITYSVYDIKEALLDFGKFHIYYSDEKWYISCE